VVRLRTALIAGIVGAVLAAPSAGASVVRVSVSTRPTTAPIRDDFLGLSLEYSTIPAWTRGGGGPVDPVLVRLVRNLDPAGRPSIRIGGISTDRSWWPARGLTRPRGVTYSLSPAWALSARSLAAALGARLLLGINFEADRPPLARIEADRLLALVGRRWLAGLTIGNEPPLYTLEPWYHLLGGQVLPWYEQVGRPVFSRGPGWGPGVFTTQYSRTLRVLPDVPIAGPDTKDTVWFAAFRRFISRRSRVRIVTSHGYGLNNCLKDPASPAFPSVPHLLSAYASRGLMQGLTPFVARAHRDHMTYRIDELGSVTCNGAAGVSDTMASALWAADALFAVARAEVDGVNLHSYPGSSNGLFDFTRAAGGWTADVHPLYYGALLFARAAPSGSRLIAVRAAGVRGLRVWATRGPGRVLRVLAINDSLSTSATAVVRTPARWRSGRAWAQRLAAPSAYSTTGLTLGGRSFGPRTATGVLRPPVRMPVPRRRGRYVLTVPAAGAALMTIGT
jgi:hypothetical protein